MLLSISPQKVSDLRKDLGQSAATVNLSINNLILSRIPLAVGCNE